MVKLRRPLHSEAASGKISQQVHYRRGSSNIARRLVSPPFKQTQARLTHQSMVAACNAGWEALSQSDRNAWNALGAQVVLTNSLRLPYQRSGHNWYVSCNIRRLRLGLGINDWAPKYFVPPGPYAIDIDVITEGSLHWSYIGPIDTSDQFISEVRISGPLPPGQKPTLDKAHWLTFRYYNLPVDTLTALAPGAYGVHVRPLDSYTGLVGNWIHASTVISPAEYYLPLRGTAPGDMTTDITCQFGGVLNTLQRDRAAGSTSEADSDALFCDSLGALYTAFGD